MEAFKIFKDKCVPYLCRTSVIGPNSPLDRLYKKNQSEWSNVRLVASIANAIITQRLAFFCVEYGPIIDLCTKDLAWYGPIKLTKHDVEQTLEAMVKAGAISLMKPEGKTPAVYMVTSQDILNQIRLSDVEIESNIDSVLEYLNSI